MCTVRMPVVCLCCSLVQSLVSDQRWWRGVSCPEEEKVKRWEGRGGVGGHAAEVVRVRGLERRDGKDRNGQHGHNV